MVEHGEGVKVAVPVDELKIISPPASKEKKQDGAANSQNQDNTKTGKR
jgi:hypothetical protein